MAEEFVRALLDWWLGIGTQWRCILISLSGLVVTIISSNIMAARTAKGVFKNRENHRR